MMRKILILLLIIFPFIADAQSQSGVQWDQYYITGSLSVGMVQRAQYADNSAWLQVGSDTSTKGLIVPRGIMDSILNPHKGIIFFDNRDSTLNYFDGLTWHRHLVSLIDSGIRYVTPYSLLNSIIKNGYAITNTPTGTFNVDTNKLLPQIDSGRKYITPTQFNNSLPGSITSADTSEWNYAYTAINNLSIPQTIYETFLSTASQTTFTDATNLKSSNVLLVSVSGVVLIRGTSSDQYVFDSTLGKITFNNAIAANQEVSIIYTKYGTYASIGGRYNLITVTAPTYTVSISDKYILANTASNNIDVTLSTMKSGDVINIKKTNTLHNLTITPGSGTIDGQSNVSTTYYGQSWTILFDGTNYFIL